MTDDIFEGADAPEENFVLLPEPLPEPAPEPEPVPEPEEPAVPVEVVTVEDLLDRLTGTDQDETAEPSQEEEASEEEPLEDPAAEPVETVGMDAVLKHLETLQGVADHPMMETPFDNYTVTEGLLLLIFVILFLEFFLNLLRRWF